MKNEEVENLVNDENENLVNEENENLVNEEEGNVEFESGEANQDDEMYVKCEISNINDPGNWKNIDQIKNCEIY